MKKNLTMDLESRKTDFFIHSDYIPGKPDKYQAFMDKYTEPEENIPESHKGTRKPENRHSRWLKTQKAKAHLREIFPRTVSVKEAGNGGYTKCGNTYEWHPVWKKIDKRLERHAGKETCRDYWKADTREFNIPEELQELEAEINWLNENGHWDTELQEFVWDEDEEHNENYDPYYDPYDEGYDPEEAIALEIESLKRQINTYKDFLGEFNLNKLYDEWWFRNHLVDL